MGSICFRLCPPWALSSKYFKNAQPLVDDDIEAIELKSDDAFGFAEKDSEIAKEAESLITTDVETTKKEKKKKIKEDGSDSDDEEASTIKLPSAKKAIIITTIATTGLLLSTYFKMHPLVPVGFSMLAGTTTKTLLRRVQRIPRYISLASLTAAGFAVDYLAPSPVNKFNFGPIALSFAIPAISRSLKLWMLGKLEKDNPKDKERCCPKTGIFKFC